MQRLVNAHGRQSGGDAGTTCLAGETCEAPDEHEIRPTSQVFFNTPSVSNFFPSTFTSSALSQSRSMVA